MLTEQEAQLKIEREQRWRDVLLMRSMDKVLGVERQVIDNPLIEMNIKMIIYVEAFSTMSIQFLALQTLQDLRQHIIIMQAKKINPDLPVALLRDEKNTKVFVNNKLTKEDFKAGGVFYFVREDMRGE